MIKTKKLSIVIPAYNEEKRIGSTIHDYYNYFMKNKINFEVIAVSDGSTDRTNEIVNRMNRKNTRLIEFPKRMGKGWAIKKGLMASGGDIAGFVDADGSLPPKDYHKMAACIGRYDCVIASRRATGSIIIKKQPVIRRIFSSIFNIIVNTLFNLGIMDTQCGGKVFSREAVKKTIPLVKTNGYLVDVEILWKLRKNGFGIKEYPVEWAHVTGGSFSPVKHGPRMLMDILKLRLFG